MSLSQHVLTQRWCTKTQGQFLPVVPANNTVWVEHWNELEDKHVSECVGPRVVSSQDKVEETVKNKGGGRLPRVHSTAEEKHLQTHTDTQELKISITVLSILGNYLSATT